MKFYMRLEEAEPPLKKLIILKCKDGRVKKLFESLEFDICPLM